MRFYRKIFEFVFYTIICELVLTHSPPHVVKSCIVPVHMFPWPQSITVITFSCRCSLLMWMIRCRHLTDLYTILCLFWKIISREYRSHRSRPRTKTSMLMLRYRYFIPLLFCCHRVKYTLDNRLRWDWPMERDSSNLKIVNYMTTMWQEQAPCQKVVVFKQNETCYEWCIGFDALKHIGSFYENHTQI